MAEIKIIEAHDVPAIEPARQGQWDKFVTYLVDGTLRRFVRLPAQGATKEKIVEAIRRDQAELKALAGHTFTV
jgi:hypothetical protein